MVLHSLVFFLIIQNTIVVLIDFRDKVNVLIKPSLLCVYVYACMNLCIFESDGIKSVLSIYYVFIF